MMVHSNSNVITLIFLLLDYLIFQFFSLGYSGNTFGRINGKLDPAIDTMADNQYYCVLKVDS